jgi:hypothetical protein
MYYSNSPASPGEAEAIFSRWPHLDSHCGRRIETVGRTIQRQLDGEPDPLPDRFIDRLLVTPRFADFVRRACNE